MSAICGLRCRSGELSGQASLDAMMRALSPHGPDGAGHWNDAQTWLGHQMMHTTPESLREGLPLKDPASGVVLTADARLDNRDDLARALGVGRSEDPTDSDLLLRAYLKWGTGCAERLVGEFAIAIWDGRSRSLHCFTDPMGIRPLFYRISATGDFAFASEVRALLHVQPEPPALNAERIAMLGISALTVYLEPEATCFERVYRVPAASVLTVGERAPSVREYWAPDPRKRLRFSSEEECGEAFREVFFQAVGSRLRSAFPVASMLSGGLDSSSIVGCASQLLEREHRRLTTLSSRSAPEFCSQAPDESSYIDLFADYRNIDMADVCAPDCGPFDNLAQLVKSVSLCSYSFQHYLYTAFTQSARDAGARVLLDGDGGELTASCAPSGYVAELLLAGKWWQMATLLRSMHPRGSIERWQISRELIRPIAPLSIMKAFGRLKRSSGDVAFPVRSEFVDEVLGARRKQVEQELMRLSVVHPDHRKNMVKNLLLERSDARQRSHAGFLGYQSVQFSYPFLDRRVIDFVLAVDGRFKQHGSTGRLLLRRSMSDIVPSPILARTSKAPFAPDYANRYRRDRDLAFRKLRDFTSRPEIATIVDFQKAYETFGLDTSRTAPESMVGDVDSQFTVPYATYLCYFLNHCQGQTLESTP